MDRGFRRCNRSNLQTGAVAKKGVIGGFGRSRAPYAGGGSWRGVADRRTGRSGEWLGVACAVSPAIVAGGRSRRSGRKSERVTGPCGQMPRPRNGEAAWQQPNRFGWMSDFRRRNLSLSRNCSRISARSRNRSLSLSLSRNRNRNRCRVRGGSCGHSRRRYSASTNL